MQGLDVYRCYLAMKQHFTNPKFDFFQYDGKVKASEKKYQERTDFYFFETMARKLSDKEIKEYLLASFIAADDPSKVWIGDIKRSGKDHWLGWQKQRQSELYTFEQDLCRLAQHLAESQRSFNHLFKVSSGHPPALRAYAAGKINLHTLIILDMVLGFIKEWDAKLRDPLWEMISFKIKKYKPFLSISKDKYITLIKEQFL